jgi:ribosomal protein S18 acetylase RimI-like enzyme
MSQGDIPAVVDLHLRSFPGFFLSFLGRGFLRVLYASLLADSQGVALVATAGGAITGFVAGVENQSGFYRRLLRDRLWSFAFASAGAALRRPSILPRLVRALGKPAETEQASASACLMSIAVDPGAEGGGVGALLVRGFCDAIAGRGGEAVCLTTDRDGNERVNEFYRRLGFELARTFQTKEGRFMNEYRIAVTPGKS